jgi:protein phosphatase-4 regulatory subunit 3
MTVTRESEDGDVSDRTDDSATAIELPPCELSRLEDIHSLVMSSVTGMERLMLELAIEKDSYISKLLDLFHVCEDLENTEGLRQLFDIFRTLIFHNNASMFQVCW